MPDIAIREATIDDCPLILRFIQELADYEKASDQVESTVASLRESLFGPTSPCRALICHVDGEEAGFAVYFHNYSTWQGRRGLYLEDLYVSPKHRGAGAGKALLHRLAQTAVALGCGRFEWSVLDWNQPAIDFYKSIGAAPQDEWVRYRLAGDALHRFAERG